MSKMHRLLRLNQKANRLLSSAHSKIEWEALEGADLKLPDHKVLENPSEPYSVYVHLPFCERFCTFCGCNTSITGDHSWEDRYLKLLEIEKRQRFGEDLQLQAKRLVLAGGTPTFFSTKSLKRLLKTFFVDESKEHFTSIEIDPRYCTEEHIDFFDDHSFSQFRLAVVDVDPRVQKMISRKTDEGLLRNVCDSLKRKKGSLQLEWIIGLPGQSDQTQKQNLKLLVELNPAEVVVNRFIKVPWLKEHQKSYAIEDIPSPDQVNKWEELWIESLLNMGYCPIGFGAWVKQDDKKQPWSQAQKSLSLSKDLSGMYPFKMEGLLGFGVGSQSMTKNRVSRNYSALPVYQRELERGHSSIEKVGHYSDTGMLANGVTGEVLNLSTEQLKKMADGIEIPESQIRHFIPLLIAIESKLIEKEQAMNG